MKTYKTHFLIAILLGLVFISCEDDVEYLETTTAAKEVTVPESAKVNEKFDIDLVVYGSSGCSSFSRFNMNHIGDTTYFELFQKRVRNANAYCTTAIIEIQTTISVSFSEPGTKYLKFNDSTIFSEYTTEIIKSIEIK
jgi:hypothetical protein